MKVLLDTNILVRAAISPSGLARAILDRMHGNDEHVLVVSSHILSEVADVLSRPRMQTRWPLSQQQVESYCQFLSGVAEVTSIRPLTRIIADPKDQAIFEATVAAHVDVICTGDVHFADKALRGFLAGYGIAVTSDHELLTVLT